MGNANFFQVIIGILVILAVAFIYFFVSGKNKSKSGNSDPDGITVTQNKETQKNGEDLSDDELIAVLTAAVMAMRSNSGVKIRVTSFRRIPQSAPVWNTVGRRERMENKL